MFALKGDAGAALLRKWRAWASRSPLTAFVELARRIGKNRAGIHAALTEGLSNALVESTNTKLRVLTRMASASRNPSISSLSPCLIEAATALRFPAGARRDPRKQQESLLHEPQKEICELPGSRRLRSATRGGEMARMALWPTTSSPPNGTSSTSSRPL